MKIPELEEKKTTNVEDISYTDFRADPPRHLTRVDHEAYMKTAQVISPWSSIPGWHLWTCLHDLMHILYLGTARDLIGSLLVDFIDHNCLGSPDVPVRDQLRSFSISMHKYFKERK